MSDPKTRSWALRTPSSLLPRPTPSRLYWLAGFTNGCSGQVYSLACDVGAGLGPVTVHNVDRNLIMTNLRRPQRVLRTTWMRAFSSPWHRTLHLRGTISPHISFATPRRLVESSLSSCWLRSNSLFGFPSSCLPEGPPAAVD